MSKNKKLTYEDVLQLIHSSPNERMKKMWENVLKKLKEHPPRKLEPIYKKNKT